MLYPQPSKTDTTELQGTGCGPNVHQTCAALNGSWLLAHRSDTTTRGLRCVSQLGPTTSQLPLECLNCVSDNQSYQWTLKLCFPGKLDTQLHRCQCPKTHCALRLLKSKCTSLLLQIRIRLPFFGSRSFFMRRQQKRFDSKWRIRHPSAQRAPIYVQIVQPRLFMYWWSFACNHSATFHTSEGTDFRLRTDMATLPQSDHKLYTRLFCV